MACSRLATNTLAGLCALWLLSSAPSSGKLPTTCKTAYLTTHLPSMPQHLLLALQRLYQTAEAQFLLSVSHSMPSRGSHAPTGRALYAVVGEQCLLLWKTGTDKSQHPQTTCPALSQHPVRAMPRLSQAAEAAGDLAVPFGMPSRAGHTHTDSRALRTVGGQ